MADIVGFTSKPRPLGTDDRYREGQKKERARREAAHHRLLLAQRAAKSPEQLEIEADLQRAIDEAHFQRRRDMDEVGIRKAAEIYDERVGKLRAEAKAKIDDLLARLAVEGGAA